MICVFMTSPHFWLLLLLLDEIAISLSRYSPNRYASISARLITRVNRKSRHFKIIKWRPFLMPESLKQKTPSYLLLSACIRIVFNCSDLVRLCQTLQRKISHSPCVPRKPPVFLGHGLRPMTLNIKSSAPCKHGQSFLYLMSHGSWPSHRLSLAELRSATSCFETVFTWPWSKKTSIHAVFRAFLSQ